MEEQHQREEKQQCTYCEICSSCPCDWVQYFLDEYIQLLEQATNKTREYSHASIRHRMYKEYIYLKYGKLGKRKRIRVPNCVEEKIKKTFPDPNNKYVGFKEADDNSE